MAEDEDGGVKRFPAIEYEVGREKIHEFVDAIGERRAIYHDRKAAKDAGFRDLVAPPMFCVVYAGKSVLPAIEDPEVGIDMKRMLHVGQRFQWGEPVCAGDVVTTEAELSDVSEKGRNKVFTFGSVSRNQKGDEVARGMWTMLVKGG